PMSTKQNNAERTERLSVWSQLYRGETRFQIVANRRRWYLFSAILITGCAIVMLTKGFVLGIDFAGGHQYRVPATDGASLTQVEDAAAEAGAELGSGQVAGSGEESTYIIRTGEMDAEQADAVRQAMAEAAEVAPEEISVSTVSATWGAAVTKQALIALVIFLVLI